MGALVGLGACLWLWSGVLAVVMGCAAAVALGSALAWLWSWPRFVARVALQRCTQHLYVVHSGTAEPELAEAVRMAEQQGQARGMKVSSVPASQWNPFSMLWGAVAVLFVLSDAPGAQQSNARLAQWMASEASTRLIEGNHYGHT